MPITLSRQVPTVLSRGDCLRPGVFRLHSSFTRAANYVAGDRLVSLVDERIGPGPMNLVIGGRRVPWGDSLTLTDEAVWLGDSRLPLPEAPWSSRPCLDEVRPGLDHRLTAQMAFLLRQAPRESIPWLHRRRPALSLPSVAARSAEVVAQGMAWLFGGREADGVRTLCGSGIGLTPSGDDFLVGHLAARFLLSHTGFTGFLLPMAEFIHIASGTCLLSRSALSLASEGCFASPVKGYLEALALGHTSALRTQAWRLLGMGSTSGADLMAGLLFSLHQAVSP